MNLDDELLLNAEDDRLTVEFIQRFLPQEVKDKFTEENLYYFLDVLVDYYANSGILDKEPDKDGCIDIDIDAIAQHMAEQARKDKMGEFDCDDLRWVVEGELEYGEGLSD